MHHGYYKSELTYGPQMKQPLPNSHENILYLFYTRDQTHDPQEKRSIRMLPSPDAFANFLQ
jgi:hypothetical protein